MYNNFETLIWKQAQSIEKQNQILEIVAHNQNGQNKIEDKIEKGLIKI
jgi:hypothetical protein